MWNVRSKVNIYGQDGVKKGAADMPAVFSVLYRPDVVERVVMRSHLCLRQAYAVSDFAGYQTAAESWGTGRAVARVPRVPGGGSHRSGQAAFANFCRGGGMFAPTKTYRKWTRQTNLNERRHAQAFALSAAGCPSLVTARGHRIENVPELPLVVDNSVESISKTKDMMEVLKKCGAEQDLERCADRKKIRAGTGKSRNRKYKRARGPLVIYKEGETLPRACKNLQGVDVMKVDHLNVRLLAPGGKGGRFIIFTEGAFNRLNEIFGDQSGVSVLKKGYSLPRAVTNGNVLKVMGSDQLQSALRPKMINPKKPMPVKFNPLRNKKALK